MTFGHKLEEEFDVNVTFPEEYHAKELAGKAAVFKTVIHNIKHIELPELDDDFAKDVSEFDTMDEYRADVKAKIAKRHDTEADNKFEDAILESLIEKLEADIPEAMYVAETENFVRDYDNRLRMQGLDLKTYFQYTGMTLETLREQMRPQAERQVKLRLALEKIAALEALEATEEEINGEYENIANSYNMPVDQVKASIDASAIAEDMKVKKAMDLVKETAKITKPRKPAAKKKAEAEVDNAIAEALMEKLVAEIPEPMFAAETENYVRDYDTRLRQSGLDLQTYFKYTGLTLDALRAQMRPQAEKQVKIRLALEKIASLEALTVSDEEIEAEYKRVADTYNVELDQVKSMIMAEDLKADLLVAAAMKFVKENAEVVKAKKATKNTEDTAAEAPAKKPAAFEPPPTQATIALGR